MSAEAKREREREKNSPGANKPKSNKNFQAGRAQERGGTVAGGIVGSG